VGLGILCSGTWHWSWNDAVIGGFLILLLLVHIYGRRTFLQLSTCIYKNEETNLCRMLQ
jgi:hypothetical protein